MDREAVIPDATPDRDRPTLPITLVTGGSEGIGIAIAGRFAARGHRLLLIARGAEALEAAAAGLRQRHGGEVATLVLDLTSRDCLEQLDARLAGLGGHVEILVNNAGMGQCGAFADAEPRLLEQLVDLNVAAPGRLMRHVLPGMRQRRRGGILNIASLGGYVPGPYQAAYYASKAYLVSLSEAVAAEAHADGVRVTVVAPGPVNSAFHEKMGAETAYYRRFLPAMTPEGVAGWAVRGFDLGARVVVPGFLNLLGFAALRIAPHRLLIPAMAALLYPRGPSGRGTREDA